MRKCLHILPFILFLCLTTQSCSVQSLHEAQTVVAKADSLRTQGQPYTDSTRMAQAYATLNNWQYFYPDDYAHACYHYGRILRNNDNPAEAMQAFINATHSRTKDYHILGRVYSNMGTICHLAESFLLAYDMYSRCTDYFWQVNDTITYYYGVYRMAFEKAELADSTGCRSLLQRIEQIPHMSELVTMTRAELCLRCHKYDSAIYYANEACAINSNNATGILIKAQTFSYLQLHDSAAYYANIIMEKSKSLYDIHNALYILTNDDETKDKDAIRQTAADRADVQKLLKIRQGKLSQAVQLLEQELKRKYDWTWVYAVTITLLIFGISLTIYIYPKRKRHQLLAQQIGDLEQSAVAIQQRHEELTELYITNHQRVEEEIIGKCELLRNSNNIIKELSWTDFDTMSSIIDRLFYMLVSKLRKKKVLNETEIRLCVLVLMGFSRAQIADILPYAQNGIGKLKDITAKKLGTTGKKLHDFLLNLAIKG